MSDTQPPVREDNDFDDKFDKELIQMWQENTYPVSGNTSDISGQLEGLTRKFDRRIFWRNVLEYGAGVVVLVRSVFDMAYGDRLLFAPLTSFAVALFVMAYIWKQHRVSSPIDPVATANAYRTALLDRLDRQIRLTRSVRYWYVLPAWIFFLTVLASGLLQGRAFVPLLMEFLSVSALCILVIWLNERFGLRSLEAEKARVLAIDAEVGQG